MTGRASFRNLQDGTAQDWKIIAGEFQAFSKGLADRVLRHLSLLKGDFGGFPIDRLDHSLQTATRAFRDGRDEAYVCCALLHDIGDTLGSFNHPDIAAAVLKPFVGESEHWMVQHHGIFQGYYFFHHLGLDRHMREQYRQPPGLRAHGGVLRAVRQSGLRPGWRDSVPAGIRADGAQAVRTPIEQPLRQRNPEVVAASATG